MSNHQARPNIILANIVSWGASFRRYLSPSAKKPAGKADSPTVDEKWVLLPYVERGPLCTAKLSGRPKGNSYSKEYRATGANDKDRLSEKPPLLATITEKPSMPTLGWELIKRPPITVTAGAADMAVRGAD